MSEDDQLETEKFGCAIITQEEKMISYYCSDPTVGFICDINGQNFKYRVSMFLHCQISKFYYLPLIVKLSCFKPKYN